MSEIVYPYHDENGVLLFEVVRRGEGKGKTFVQRHYGDDGEVIWNIEGIRHVLYRLPEIQRSPFVFIPEGEKDANRLVAEGLPMVTTNHGGAGPGKWLPEYTKQLVEAGVKAAVILPDNDKVGLTHAKEIAKSCREHKILTKIVQLPGLDEKGDVSDWLDAGHTIDELRTVVSETKVTSAFDLVDAPALTDKKKKKDKPKHAYANVFRHFLKLPKTVKGNVMMACPFHNDDTPSFSVSLSKGQFFCHGNCTAEDHGGGVVKFVQRWYLTKEQRTLSAEEAKAIAVDIDMKVTMSNARESQCLPTKSGKQQSSASTETEKHPLL